MLPMITNLRKNLSNMRSSIILLEYWILKSTTIFWDYLIWIKGRTSVFHKKLWTSSSSMVLLDTYPTIMYGQTKSAFITPIRQNFEVNTSYGKEPSSFFCRLNLRLSNSLIKPFEMKHPQFPIVPIWTRVHIKVVKIEPADVYVLFSKLLCIKPLKFDSVSRSQPGKHLNGILEHTFFFLKLLLLTRSPALLNANSSCRNSI